MFYKYEIKKEKDEQILYLFVDDRYEFAVFKKQNEIDLKDKIKKYIKDMKINFKGTKIALVVGGIVVIVLLNTSLDTNNMINDGNPQIISKEIIKNEEIVEEEDSIVSEEEKNNRVTIEEFVEEEVIIKEEAKDITLDKNQTSKKEVVVEKKEEPIASEAIPTGTMVTVVRSSGVILQIELEEYLIGVVAGEMPASFNIEALRAQAVVARTYTLKRISEGKALTDTEATQVYKDNTQLRVLWGSSFDTYYNKIKNAVESTYGEYITYNGSYIDAVYHSTSNGFTEDAIHVWGYNIPYLKSVSSHWDLSASTYLRISQKTDAEILNIMGIDINSDPVIEVLERSSSNRINKIEINENIYSGLDLYKKLGLRSRDFDFEVVDNILNITTRGYGHGVGMSQYGANGMANAGHNYRAIINHYYTDVQLASI